MFKTIFVLFVLLFSSLVSGQSQKDLPIIGDISNIKDFTKVYISAESTDAYKTIKKELGKLKTLEIVNNPSDAEFILEYRILDKQEKSGLASKTYEERGEMKAYFEKDGKTIVAWSDTETLYMSGGMATSRPNEINLVRNFVKALKKVKQKHTAPQHFDKNFVSSRAPVHAQRFYLRLRQESLIPYAYYQM